MSPMPLRSIVACSMATRIAFYEAGASAELREVDPQTKVVQQDGSNFRAINPLGLVPTLRTDDGVVLTENAAILQYVAEQFPASSLGARTPAPGGGSASALIAALGAALGAMVGWMTYGKRKFADKDAVMRKLIPPLHETMEALIPMIDADTDAFNDYLAALGLPKETPEAAAAREAAMQRGLHKAIDVPLQTMRLADRCWPALAEMADHGNIASRSDLEVGARALETGIWGAWRNVVINVDQITDAAHRATVTAEADTIVARARDAAADVQRRLDARKA